MAETNVLIAFGLTFLAGLSTGIGSLIAFVSKEFSPKYLAGSLGFSAGVMIYVSMVELFAQSRASLISFHGVTLGNWLAVGSFFLGVFLIGIIDKLVPTFENPHEIGVIQTEETHYLKRNGKLLRTGLMSALAIFIHNFPEGLATFFGSLKDPILGVTIAIAIAIHNIPEGVVISVPIYFATKSKRKAFVYSFMTGFAEPLGALIGFLLLRNFLNESMFGILFAFVAGVMVFISLDELLPTAERFGEHHIAIYGLILGMIVMALSLLLML
ncbi:MAG: zinc transporter ZupT [Ignavibacteria bacterium]|nr:zinc transporter ZupT [Ignavibacteria bacterium]